MTSVFPDFPYSVDDEPTPDWTVEQVMQWCLLKSHQATDRHHDELIAAMEQKMQQGKEALMSCHEQVVADAQKEESENVDPQQQQKKQQVDSSAAATKQDSNTTAAATKQRAKKPAKTKAAPALKTIHVVITGGEYTGKTFDLHPKTRSPCFVGRSAGKKFRERGISLPKDPEVSTTHGKFEIKSGKAYYTDTGSTNGTLYEEQELEDNVPLELKDGMVLQLGGTILSITLGWS